MSGGFLDLGTPEFNDVGKDIKEITIDFLLMDMIEVYAIQSVVAAEIKVRECAMAKQMKDANKNIMKMKLLVEENE